MQGGVTITVENFVHDISKKDYLKVSVEDSGVGIKPDEINHLFNLFGKLESSSGMNT